MPDKEFFLTKWLNGLHIGRGIGNFFHSFKENVSKIAIGITEAVKTATEGTLFKTLASTIDTAFKTHLASDVLDLIHKGTLKALAVELAIEGLSDNPTEQDILDFENRVIAAITGLSPKNKSKLWTTLASQIYGLVQEATKDDTTLTWAEIVEIVETAYQDFLQDKADEENNSL